MQSENLTRGILWLALVALSLPTTGEAREKADIVQLKNGDRVTGEITSLEYGQLRVVTDSMGTVAIRWPDITSVQSKQSFIVEDDVGGRYYGMLATDKELKLLRVDSGEGEHVDLGLLAVTRMAPGEATFWNRLEGSFSLGFDFAKASEITTLSSSVRLAYRAPTFRHQLNFDTNSTKDPTQGTLDRNSLGYQYQWYLPKQRFWSGLAQLERNEETGIEARLQVGGGLGQYFLQTARSEVSGLVGIVAVEEWATGAEDSQSSLEGLIAGSWRIFKFETPKISLNSTAILYPSITESGRYRSELDISLRQEIVSDFYVDLSLYHTYDTDPPDATADKDDYGITTSLGYSFR